MCSVLSICTLWDAERMKTMSQEPDQDYLNIMYEDNMLLVLIKPQLKILETLHRYV